MKEEFGNTNSKDIFGNHLLCAQFFRNCTGIPILACVQPEDIVDETEKLRPFVGVEYEGDVVKRVRVHRGGNGDPADTCPPIYVVTLLEHKSRVDYDVTFQLLKYMVGIWAIYRDEQNKKHRRVSGTKDFRYPLIIPIVYYEGRGNWTAAMHWQDRVELSGMFGEYVPNFTYKVVNLHSYSNDELLSREEELSLVMMLNRVQTAEDLDIATLSDSQKKTVENILTKAPEAVLHLLTQMVYHFGLKMNIREAELMRYVKNVEDRNMGELWANMEKMDIQAERRNTAEARRLLEEAQQTIADKDQTIADLQAKLAKLQEKLNAQ